METSLKSIIEALVAPGRYVEVHFEESLPTLISYAGADLDSISQSGFTAGNIRFFEKGSWAFYSFNHNDFNKIKEEAQKILSVLSFIPSSSAFLKSSQTMNDKVILTPLKNPAQMSLEEKNNLIFNYNQILRKESRITTTKATYKDVLRKIHFANSEGSYIYQEKTFTGFSIYAMAKEGANVQQAFFSNAGYGGLEWVQNYEHEAENIVKTALDLLKAKSIEKGKYPVILDNRIAGVFAHEAFGHLSEADHLYENPDLLNMMQKGKVFGSPQLNIVDDGSLPDTAGYTPYDDEGVKGKKNYLVKDGKLKGRLHNRETAAKMQEELTGNARSLNPLYPPIVRMTNTFIDAGTEKKEALFDKMQDGIYCVDYIGGMTNLEMFTFTAGRAYRVKKGKIQELLKDVVLSGNVFETLHQITHIADDLKHFGTLGGCGKGGQSGLPVTIGSPHVLAKEVLIG